MRTHPKIKVVQYMWGEENKSYGLAREINEDYCRRHGYKYVCKNFPPTNNRSPHWEKIVAMTEELESCDYLLFLDADAYFYGQEFKIENMLLPLLGDKTFLMAADCGSEECRWHEDLPNTGVIFVRNCTRAKEMLSHWNGLSDHDDFQQLRFKRLHEQGALWKSLWQTHRDDFAIAGDYYLMNGFYGLFIRHQMVTPDIQRLSLLENHRHRRRRKKWKWGIALTTSDRPEPMLARTLESFRNTGFDPPVVFYDREKKCGIWNLHRALAYLVETIPNADAYAIIEDDVIFAKNIRSYLESELWPSLRHDGCVCSLFTPTCYLGPEKWRRINRGSQTYMSQFRIYHPISAEKLVEAIPQIADFQSHERQNDKVVGEWIARNDVDIWFHTPSLAQHVGVNATTYPSKYVTNYRLGLSRDFVGEDFHVTAKTIDDYRRNRRGRQAVESFEINLLNFIPADAKKLAAALHEHNCDIESLTFMGDKSLTRENLCCCIDILRMTGKVLQVKLRLPQTMRKARHEYASLVDEIEIADSEITCMNNESDNELLPQAGFGKSFRLLKNQVYCCGGDGQKRCQVEIDTFFADLSKIQSSFSGNEYA